MYSCGIGLLLENFLQALVVSDYSLHTLLMYRIMILYDAAYIYYIQYTAFQSFIATVLAFNNCNVDVSNKKSPTSCDVTIFKDDQSQSM